MSIYDIEVHPSAAIFPMLSNEELNSLAEDIKENGLNHPIVVDDGVLIDGRNRLAACEIAGIEPVIVPLGDRDVNAFIISENLNRRDMTKGQKAMAHAVLSPEPKKLKRKFPEETSDVNKASISKARTIIRHKPELVPQVLSAAKTLNNAYDEALEEQRQEEERVENEKEKAKKMALLQNNAADLYDLIIDEKLSFEDALAVYEKRSEEHTVRVLSDKEHLETLLNGIMFAAGGKKGVGRLIAHTLEAVEEHKRMLPALDKEVFKMALENLNDVGKLLEEFYDENY